MDARDHYRACITRAKLANSIEQESDNVSYLHATLDLAQQATIPHHARQVGPLYFRVLRRVDLDLPFTVVTDANDVAPCGVLLQKDRDNAWHPIAYRSRRLRKEGKVQLYGYGKRNYGRYHACLEMFLFFQPFVVVSDNPGVKYLRTKKYLSTREARWVEFLADFDFNTFTVREERILRMLYLVSFLRLSHGFQCRARIQHAGSGRTKVT